MKFTTQEEYGLRCLIQIAKHQSEGGLTIPQISDSEGLSESNTAKLLRILRLGGIIESSRGQEGGYRLAKPADQINVSEVLNVLGGKLFEDDFCDKHSGFEKTCLHNSGCSVRSLWQTVQQAVDQILSNVTLNDLLGTDKTFHHQVSIPILQAVSGD
ncbi:MAG: Rrf2 family transcriptional regulator [Bacteroidetes bacterium]|nr:Rrf2 family transcriptional regulator [Bacteroidota bacterium]